MPRARSLGQGLLNSVINSLPFELHIPGYQYCGPGTHLAKRLARGDAGINPLDKFCREHDITYSQSRDLETRHNADRKLAEQASRRVEAGDSTLLEKAAAWAVSRAMKVKLKMGAGLKRKGRKKISGGKLSKQNKKKHVSQPRRKRVKRGKPRILPPGKRGGFLPFLVPLLAGLSAVGSLAGGAAGIAKSVNQASNARKLLSETERHNRAMEQHGRGLYLNPYKKGGGMGKKKTSKLR